MQCRYKDSIIPRCQIVPHPNRDNIEYCRICEEWRYLSDVGNDFPGVFWSIVAIAIALAIFVQLMNEHESRILDNQKLPSDAIGQMLQR